MASTDSGALATMCPLARAWLKAVSTRARAAPQAPGGASVRAASTARAVPPKNVELAAQAVTQNAAKNDPSEAVMGTSQDGGCNPDRRQDAGQGRRDDRHGCPASA